MFQMIEYPLQEPLTLSEVKAQLRMDDLAGDAATQAKIDADLLSKIRAVRERCEGFTRRSLITQRFYQWIDRQDGLGLVSLLRGPIQQIHEIAIFPPYAGDVIIVDPVDYSLSSDTVFFNHLLPRYRDERGIRVEVTAGYGDDPEDIPSVLIEGMKELLAFWYMNPEGGSSTAKYEVEARLSGDLPAQISSKWRMKRRIIA